MVLCWRRHGRAGGCQIEWGCSSVGRAPALQAGGQGFESLHLHCVYSTHSRCEHRKHSFLGHGITCQCIWIYNRLGMQAFHTVPNPNALASLCTLKIAYRKYKISLTQKIQDIREKTKMFVNTNEPKTNACNAIQVGTKTVIRRSYASCSYPLLRKWYTECLNVHRSASTSCPSEHPITAFVIIG